MSNHSFPMSVGPFAKTLRRAWRDARIAVFMPLFLAASLFLIVGIAALSKGALFDGASLAGATEGKNAVDVYRQAFLALVALLTLLSICSYRKPALIVGAVCMVTISVLSAFEILEALRPPVRPADFVVMGLVALTAGLAIDYLVAFRALSISQSPSLGDLETFARLCRNRRRRYWATEPLKVLWLIPAALLGLAAAVLLQLAKAYTTITLLGVPPEAFRQLERMFEWIEAHPIQYAGVFVAEAIQLILTIVGFVYAFRFFWPLTRRSAELVIADETYQPIVFLRSFRDEQALLRSRRAFDRMTFRKRRLEEVVVRMLAPLGPAVAVGVPGERIPKLGALRAYYPEDQWREAVLSWISRSYVVVVVAGLSPWALWEFNHVLASGMDGRLLLVVPHESDTAARRLRWEKVCEAARGTHWHNAMVLQDPTGLIAVLFSPDGRLIALSGRADEQVDVEVAVRLATGHLAPA